MLENYTSKIKLAYRLSANFSTFFNILINSKKYSSTIKNNIPQKKDDKTIESYNINLNDKVSTIKMRTYSGDIDIFYEIFWRKVYEIPFKLKNDVKVIVDLGAHIGFASIYFLTKHPNAKIYAVEASKENFDLLKKNIENFRNIIIKNAAIYTQDGSVKFNDNGFSYNSKLSTEGTAVNAISMNSLIKANNIEKIDLLKIDIEGAEKLILRENNSWLEHVESIIIEIHDDYTIEHLKIDLESFGFIVYSPSKEFKTLKNIFATKNGLNKER